MADACFGANDEDVEIDCAGGKADARVVARDAAVDAEDAEETANDAAEVVGVFEVRKRGVS